MRVGEALATLTRSDGILAQATLEIMLMLADGPAAVPTTLANLAVAHRRVAAAGEEPVKPLEAAVQILEAMERQGFVSIHDPTALRDTRAQLAEAKTDAEKRL
jgi:hypothetical protein